MHFNVRTVIIILNGFIQIGEVHLGKPNESLLYQSTLSPFVIPINSCTGGLTSTDIYSTCLLPLLSDFLLIHARLQQCPLILDS